uniref:Uncharacterized protein n=1 Tax=Steinernema glaseri TaxID=37863 RepID=A0A1I7XXH0_9BILA
MVVKSRSEFVESRLRGGGVLACQRPSMLRASTLIHLLRFFCTAESVRRNDAAYLSDRSPRFALCLAIQFPHFFGGYRVKPTLAILCLLPMD